MLYQDSVWVNISSACCFIKVPIHYSQFNIIPTQCQTPLHEKEVIWAIDALLNALSQKGEGFSFTVHVTCLISASFLLCIYSIHLNYTGSSSTPESGGLRGRGVGEPAEGYLRESPYRSSLFHYSVSALGPSATLFCFVPAVVLPGTQLSLPLSLSLALSTALTVCLLLSIVAILLLSFMWAFVSLP